MTDEPTSPVAPTADTEPVERYEPPQVESVMTAADLVREIQYAGGVSQVGS